VSSAAQERHGAVEQKVAKTRSERVEALRRAFGPRLTRSSAGLVVEDAPGGRRVVELEGRFGHATVVRQRPDGRFESACFDDQEKAVRFLTEFERR
jgi:hypothetical protein